MGHAAGDAQGRTVDGEARFRECGVAVAGVDDALRIDKGAGASRRQPDHAGPRALLHRRPS
jgi:hypothetical protein